MDFSYSKRLFSYDYRSLYLRNIFSLKWPSFSQVADLNGKDAVHIICSLEFEEEDDVLLALSRAFLSQQLSRGDMYYLW